MKTIICGGRRYQLTLADRQWLDECMTFLPITRVVSGCAAGADTGGHLWANSHHIPVTQFRPAWRTHGRAAGIMRNSEMANYAEACIAFPGSTGTADMVRKARAKGLITLVAEENQAWKRRQKT